MLSFYDNFYDSATGKLLFKAPINRDTDVFIKESEELGFLSFRDAEVNWENVRILENGYIASVDGTFLGVIAPDKLGNRYAVNLSAVSGNDKTNWFKNLIPDPKEQPTVDQLADFYAKYKR